MVLFREHDKQKMCKLSKHLPNSNLGTFCEGGGGSGKMFPIPNKKKEKSVWLLPLPPSGPPPPLGEIVKKIFPILNLISSPFD